MPIERFEDIEAWKTARSLVKALYGIIQSPNLKHDFGSRDQVQRAAVSIMAHIAEGFDGRSDQEFVRFLSYAYRSASELPSHLYVAEDQGDMDRAAFDHLHDQATIIKKLLNGCTRYLKGEGERT